MSAGFPQDVVRTVISGKSKSGRDCSAGSAEILNSLGTLTKYGMHSGHMVTTLSKHSQEDMDILVL